MSLFEALPELVLDAEGALVRLGRGQVADQLRAAALAAWEFDEFARATYLRLSAVRNPNEVAETINLFDDIGVNVDLDGSGRVVGLEVTGYEDSLARLGKRFGRLVS